MSAFDLQPDLAAALDRLVPAESLAADWADVVRRTRPAPRRRLAFRLAIAFALFLALAAVATATYLAVRGGRVTRPTQPAYPTLIAERPNGVATIVAVVDGRERVVWRCPRNVFCGDPTSFDWSADGRFLALTLSELGGRSAYVGLHIVDVRTGRDLQIPHVPLAHPHAVSQPPKVLEALVRRTRERFACPILPGDVAWAPSSRRLAYDCRDQPFDPVSRGGIFTIGRDGNGRRRIDTGTLRAFMPAWSPDGRWIAFSTWTAPREVVRTDTKKPARVLTSSVYVVGLDGHGRRLLARDAASPSWSPDGRTIAYDSTKGVRIVAADGSGRPRLVAPPGFPRWETDGTHLAVATKHGLVLVDLATGRRTRLSTETGGGIFGQGRPAWYPGTLPRRKLEAAPCGEC